MGESYYCKINDLLSRYGGLPQQKNAPSIVTQDIKYGRASVGYITYEIDRREDTVTIEDIFVDDRYRGNGLATKAVEKVMPLGSRLVVKNIRGTGIQFWNNFGLEITAEGEDGSLEGP